MSIPKIIFIVPYRNRKTHKLFFSKYMSSLLELDKMEGKYQIYFSHQADERPFNRGATKNIGFLAIKQKYPNDYHNITFVFNDIDTVPFDAIFDYETERGTIKHFYGFKYALGGIVSIKGCDFETINGFPNFWGWGMEDAMLQKRCEQHNIQIDRRQFYPIGSPEILHLFDGVSRIINKNETLQGKKDNALNGIKTIYKLKYTISTESSNKEDNAHIIKNDNILMINIHTFECLNKYETQQFHEYDLREPSKKILQTTRTIDPSSFAKNNWSRIPFYPTSEVKKEMIQKYGKKQTDEIIHNSLKNSNTNSNEKMNEQISIITSTSNNKYSPHYASLHGIKSRATGSVNIGLGGVKK